MDAGSACTTDVPYGDVEDVPAPLIREKDLEAPREGGGGGGAFLA